MLSRRLDDAGVMPQTPVTVMPVRIVSIGCPATRPLDVTIPDQPLPFKIRFSSVIFRIVSRPCARCAG
jgi:hypothetical protein